MQIAITPENGILVLHIIGMVSTQVTLFFLLGKLLRRIKGHPWSHPDAEFLCRCGFISLLIAWISLTGLVLTHHEEFVFTSRIAVLACLMATMSFIVIANLSNSITHRMQLSQDATGKGQGSGLVPMAAAAGIALSSAIQIGLLAATFGFYAAQDLVVHLGNSIHLIAVAGWIFVMIFSLSLIVRPAWIRDQLSRLPNKA